ncbi:unnamed protein product [Acanthocheilonema viteae]|uniref:Uncharacterized protein n=1 Tax=Acanthocheilonema viteae TaxID=6277 RepID=A0A498S9D2_ACAVI|nr:unnamed protein product [Acanthocheilonema viteae]
MSELGRDRWMDGINGGGDDVGGKGQGLNFTNGERQLLLLCLFLLDATRQRPSAIVIVVVVVAVVVVVVANCTSLALLVPSSFSHAANLHKHQIQTLKRTETVINGGWDIAAAAAAAAAVLS